MSNQTLTSNDSEEYDPSLQRKHAVMLERLTDRHQTRLENSLTRKSEDSNSSLESTSSFLSRFNDSKHEIESRMSSLRLNAPPVSSQVKPQLDAVAISIADLEKLVAEKSYFLPSYEVRSSLKAVSDLRQRLEMLSSELIPKKKFSFKNKPQRKVRDSTSNGESGFEDVKPEHTSDVTVLETPGFRNKRGEVLVTKFEGSEMGEFTLSDLDSCEVRLIGCVRALFVHHLTNCRVYTGPVTASVLIDGVEGCVFSMASHQVRIHNVISTDFYLRVRSRPIIEDSKSVRFAPYCLRYEGIDRDLEAAGLDEETGNWANVDDFRWLRAVRSPNWSVLPENERISEVNI